MVRTTGPTGPPTPPRGALLLRAPLTSARVSDLDEYRYDRLTWPQVNVALAQQRVAILPTGATEQHGRHLP
ncbi:MAG: creatininase family protein, partial [Actinopolymorphaceae bacterium]